MPVREKGRRSPGSQPARPFSRLQPPADRRQSAGLFAHSLGFAAETDCLLEESRFEPLVPLATEMLIELARGITNPTRMLAVGDIRPVAAVVLTLRWDQRFESAFLQRRVRKLSVPSANPA